MPTRFRPYQPKQLLMLPPDLGEWVPEQGPFMLSSK